MEYLPRFTVHGSYGMSQQTNKQTNKQTNNQTDKQTNKLKVSKATYACIKRMDITISSHYFIIDALEDKRWGTLKVWAFINRMFIIHSWKKDGIRNHKQFVYSISCKLEWQEYKLEWQEYCGQPIKKNQRFLQVFPPVSLGKKEKKRLFEAET